MMLRTQSVLPRVLGKWVSQVAASVGATLVATAIYAALPKPVPVDAPKPELTSGGKFAARAVTPAAYDGLDTMPLPKVTPLVAVAPAEPSAGAAIVHHALWEAPAPLVLAPDHSVRAARPAHAAARIDIRRAVPAEPHPAVAAVPGPVIASAEVPAHDDGLIQSIPKVLPHILPMTLSGLHQAWSATTSAGGALVAHVVPQIP